jgi:hypothetical protein
MPWRSSPIQKLNAGAVMDLTMDKNGNAIATLALARADGRLG